MCLAIMPKYFGRPVARIVVAGHGKAIGAGIIEAEDIAFGDLADPSVVPKGVRFADVAHHRIIALPSTRIRNIFDMMIGPV